MELIVWETYEIDCKRGHLKDISEKASPRP